MNLYLFVPRLLTIVLIVEINDLMAMEDLVDDFVTFYIAGIKYYYNVHII